MRYWLAYPLAICTFFLSTACAATAGADQTHDTSVTVVERPDTTPRNDHYVGNRAPLKPLAFIKLPVGSIRPAGWLYAAMDRQREGMTGHLGQISAWLQKEDNAWLSKDGRGEWGWEEVPYWLKGYANLGYTLGDQAIIDEAKVWLEGAINSQRPDGNFGPDRRFDDDGSQDFWANMVMLHCLQSYYEYTRDPRVLEMMTRYFRYQMSVPDDKLLTHYWQHMRGGDNLHSIYWLYNRTGDAFLLDLAAKVYRNTADWAMPGDLPNWHNVNIAQGFRAPAQYSQQTHDPAQLAASYESFRVIRERYGQVPGGMFGSDEISREGFDDPRQAIETCGIVEQMWSDEIMMRISGDPFWADHAEEVAFNTAPAAFMPDYRALRYLTSPNMVSSDRYNHAPGIFNSGPFLLMNPLSHRCCQHNHSHGWPYYAEHLWLATPDNGLCAALYVAGTVTAKVGDGARVTITQETRYPFEESLRFSVALDRPARFPLYFRVPAWCEASAMKINGEAVKVDAAGGRYIRVERGWSDGDTVELALPMRLSVKRWAKNHDSASVSYGPLTFSLKIGTKIETISSTENAVGDSKWQGDLDTDQWPSFELTPTTPWNYALVLDGDPAEVFEVRRHAWPADDYPFSADAAPISLVARAKRVPNWQVDRHGLAAPLQDSPVATDEPAERVELIPMGAALLRISAFPVAGEGSDAVAWAPPALPKKLFEARASHCYESDSTAAIADDELPDNSADRSVGRHTFWPHRGSAEWLEAGLGEPRFVDQVNVYWFDDRTIGGQCRVPASWKLLYRDEQGRWQPVEGAASYGVEMDRFNRVRFEPVKTDALRIEVQLRDGFSAGVLEWQVPDTGAGLRDPRRFEQDIERFEAQADPPAGAVLCVGSSSIRFWHEHLAQDLAPLTVIPRGFGGSTMNDLLYYADRVVLPYKPRAVMIYEGDNDIADGTSPEQVLEGFEQLVAMIHDVVPGCRVYMLPIKPSLARWEMWPKMNETNRLLEAACESDDRLFYIDTVTPMLGSDGRPRPELFVEDGLHMNRAGYELWREAVVPVLVEAERGHE